MPRVALSQKVGSPCHRLSNIMSKLMKVNNEESPKTSANRKLSTPSPKLIQ